MALFKRKPTDDGQQAALAREVAMVEAVLANYEHGHRLAFGSPTRCPQCANFGYVTGVNKFDGVTHTSCLGCGIDWVITQRALKQHRVAMAQQVVAEPMGILDPAQAAVDALTELGVAPPELEVPKGRALQLLIVDDNPDDAAIVESILRPVTPHGVQTAHVATRHEGENAARLGFDVVLLDLDLPESRGLTTLKAFRDACPEPPLCVCSGREDLGMDWRTYAQQQLPKRDLPRLLSSPRAGSHELLGLLHTTIATPLAGAGA